MPRIISGRAKGLQLKSLKGDHTRPSADRTKEALFSIIQAIIPGSSCLDLFAGSGQIGLEALSRGADQAIFCEQNSQAFRVLQANLALTPFSDQARLYRKDARTLISQLGKQEEKFDFIYLDPPWSQAETLLNALAPHLSQLLTEQGILVIELDRKQELQLPAMEGLSQSKACHYGRAMLLFYKLT